MSEEAFIYEAIRTPRGKGKNGALTEVKPLNLVTGLIGELRSRFPDLDENLISDVILGCVSPVGDQGADIARTAVLTAGYAQTTSGVQINRLLSTSTDSAYPHIGTFPPRSLIAVFHSNLPVAASAQITMPCPPMA